MGTHTHTLTPSLRSARAAALPAAPPPAAWNAAAPAPFRPLPFDRAIIQDNPASAPLRLEWMNEWMNGSAPLELSWIVQRSLVVTLTVAHYHNKQHLLASTSHNLFPRRCSQFKDWNSKTGSLCRRIQYNITQHSCLSLSIFIFKKNQLWTHNIMGCGGSKTQVGSNNHVHSSWCTRNTAYWQTINHTHRGWLSSNQNLFLPTPLFFVTTFPSLLYSLTRQSPLWFFVRVLKVCRSLSLSAIVAFIRASMVYINKYVYFRY